LKSESEAASRREANEAPPAAGSLLAALLLDEGGVISLVGAGGKTSLMFRLARELSSEGAVLTTTTTRIRYPREDQSPCVITAASAVEILKRAEGLLEEHRHVTAAGGLIPDQNKLVGLAPEAVDRVWASGLFRWIIVEADGAAGRPLKAPAVHEPVVPRATLWLVGVVGLSAVGKPLTEEWVFRPQVFSAITGLPPGAAVSEEVIATAVDHEQGILKGGPGSCRRIVFLNQGDLPGGLASGKRICEHLQGRGAAGTRRVIIGQVQCEPPVSFFLDL
jgi:probable selenium-dependent hydroxylase accessory protein YqeC